jgi:hypothetical protein
MGNQSLIRNGSCDNGTNAHPYFRHHVGRAFVGFCGGWTDDILVSEKVYNFRLKTNSLIKHFDGKLLRPKYCTNQQTNPTNDICNLSVLKNIEPLHSNF